MSLMDRMCWWSWSFLSTCVLFVVMSRCTDDDDDDDVGLMACCWTDVMMSQ